MKKDSLDRFLDVALTVSIVGVAFALGMKFAKKRGVK